MKQLEREKEELLKELRLAESRTNQVRDEEHTDTLVTLLEAKGLWHYSLSFEALLSPPPTPISIEFW